MGSKGKNACGVAVGGEKSLTGELSGLWADRIEKWVCRLEPCQRVGRWSVSSKPGRFPSAAPVKQVLLEDESGDPGREAEQRDPIRAQ